MSDTLDNYRRVADEFEARVRAVPDAAWDNDTPCADWKARDIVEHVVGVADYSVLLLGGSEPMAAEAGGLIETWSAARASIESALADPERAARLVDSPVGPVSFDQLVAHTVLVDTLVHTWDLARATGLDERLDPDAVAAAWQRMRGSEIARAGLYDPAVAAPPDADEQTQFLAFLGRRV